MRFIKLSRLPRAVCVSAIPDIAAEAVLYSGLSCVE